MSSCPPLKDWGRDKNFRRYRLQNFVSASMFLLQIKGPETESQHRKYRMYTLQIWYNE